ncbi:MAG: prepilin-type N-terminal cleavage/methylation domain-containing protein [Pseudomonadota bacterium]
MASPAGDKWPLGRFPPQGLFVERSPFLGEDSSTVGRGREFDRLHGGRVPSDLSRLTERANAAAPCRGVTLIELLVVLVVLVALGGLVLVNLTQNTLEIDLDGAGGQDGKLAQQVITETTLARVAEAIVGPDGYAQSMRYARDTLDRNIGYGTGLPWPSPAEISAGRQDHPQLRYLFVEPLQLFDYAPPAQQVYDPVNQIG